MSGPNDTRRSAGSSNSYATGSRDRPTEEQIPAPHVARAQDGGTFSGRLSALRLPTRYAVIRSQTPLYRPQPYRQLAAATQAAGHDEETRRVLMEQRRDQLSRATPSRMARAWGRTLEVLLGSGYQPWRALVALALVALFAIACCVGTDLGRVGLDQSTVTPDSKSRPACAAHDRALYGLSVGLPLVKPSLPGCTPNDTREGTIISLSRPVVELIGWALATLFVAGFTSVIRKA